MICMLSWYQVVDEMATENPATWKVMAGLAVWEGLPT
jgi:hypothetical protein